MLHMSCHSLFCAAFFASGCSDTLQACLLSHVLARSVWLHRVKLFQHIEAIFGSAESVANYVASVYLWFDSPSMLAAAFTQV